MNEQTKSATIERARAVVKQLHERNCSTWDDLDRETVHAINALIAGNERLFNLVEVIAAERDNARACYDNATRLLIGVHSMMYPPMTRLPDGRTMMFRPNDPNPHEVLQELSDRIRALPDQIRNIETELRKRY